MRATTTAIRDALYRKRHEPVPAVGAWLKRIINEYFEYPAVPTNLMRLEGFRAGVPRMAACSAASEPASPAMPGEERFLASRP